MIPIYTINQSNIDTILPQLQVDHDVKTDIQNAVNAGKVVTVSKTNITYNGWTGCGYIIIDPTTGNGAYMISGGMNGGMLILTSILILLSIMFLSLAFITSETLIGPVIFYYLSYVAAFSALVAFFGKQAAEEFIECLSEIMGIHLAFYSIEKFLNYLIKIVSEGYLVYHAIEKYRECLNELYANYL